MFGNIGKIKTTNLPSDKDKQSKRAEWIGIAMLLIFIGTSYGVGRANGHTAAVAELPALAAVEAKLSRIEAAVTKSGTACERIVVDAAREPVQRP
jgi:hypothetical protein